VAALAETAHLLVVEDDPSISSMLRRGLSFEGYSVFLVTSGIEALERLRTDIPDLIILDVMLPGMDGIEVCRRIRSGGIDIPVLMLTARDEVTDRVAGLDAGADDYLVKPFAFEELVARLRALLRRTDNRGQETSTTTYQFEDLVLDTGTRFAHRGERRIELTTREFDLLQLFMLNPNQVLERDTIMDRVWGDDFPGESNVLEVYMSNLRRLLEADGEPRLLQTIRGAGYALRKPRNTG
jgi:two-component system, OmpR family, response regulator MprA